MANQTMYAPNNGYMKVGPVDTTSSDTHYLPAYSTAIQATVLDKLFRQLQYIERTLVEMQKFYKTSSSSKKKWLDHTDAISRTKSLLLSLLKYYVSEYFSMGREYTVSFVGLLPTGRLIHGKHTYLLLWRSRRLRAFNSFHGQQRRV